MLLEQFKFSIIEFLLCGQSILLANLQAMSFRIFLKIRDSLRVLLLRKQAFREFLVDFLSTGRKLIGEGVQTILLPCARFFLLCFFRIIGHDGRLCSLISLGGLQLPIGIILGHLQGGLIIALEDQEFGLALLLQSLWLRGCRGFQFVEVCIILLLHIQIGLIDRLFLIDNGFFLRLQQLLLFIRIFDCGIFSPLAIGFFNFEQSFLVLHINGRRLHIVLFLRDLLFD